MNNAMTALAGNQETSVTVTETAKGWHVRTLTPFTPAEGRTLKTEVGAVTAALKSARVWGIASVRVVAMSGAERMEAA